MQRPHRVLVTGATGYIGGRLVPRLVRDGCAVRVLARDRRRVEARPWAAGVEIAVGDVLEPETLAPALDGIDCAFYLVHSMAKGHGFRDIDVQAARAFGEAARQAGVGRIIYLGGLGDPGARLSEHLRSRQETGQALRESGVPVTEFRAAVIVGTGSISFEMVRYLVERLPVMVCPRWIYSRVQPIAVADLLDYLVAALDRPESAGRVVEIGGRDVTTYGGMMLGYARARGLKRLLLPVPVLTPRLSSYWVHLVTPIPASIGGPLIDGLRNDVVVTDTSAAELFPDISPLDYAGALTAVIEDLEQGRIETSWSDAHGRAQASAQAVWTETQAGMIVERRTLPVAAPPDAVYRAFTDLGGRRGWCFANWLWSIRGMIDRVIGGAGLRRGRRHPDDLRVGDALDFWRVEDLEPGCLLRLRAEMKTPGRAWLQFEVHPGPDGTSVLEQTAAFIPRGLMGLAYWYTLYPLHAWIFGGMARAIARRAESASDTDLSETASTGSRVVR